jgi:uncharacterized protein
MNPTLPATAAERSAARLSLWQASQNCLDHLIQEHRQYPAPLQMALQPQLESLECLQTKLKQNLVHIVAFGLVSRGKSAVLNALYGEKVFQTGPLHGVTQWPRAIRFALSELTELPPGSEPLPGNPLPVEPLQVELVDTPGLDEVDGAERGEMAQAMAQEADLILFITAGEMTPTELTALSSLARLQKPLLLVLNKHDLYPELTPELVYQQLTDPQLQTLLTPAEIIPTVAAPAPVQVRLQWPDGRTSERWEPPPLEIEPLQQKLRQFLAREGALVATMQVLRQTQALESEIAAQVLQFYQPQAEQLLWQFCRYKALGIALSPFFRLDLVANGLADLLLSRSLSKLYRLPLTQVALSQLWRPFLTSLGALFLGNLSWGLAMDWSSTSNWSAGLGTLLVQGVAAGWGAYNLGRATQAQLQQGLIWASRGTSMGPGTLYQKLQAQLRPEMIASRLQPHPNDGVEKQDGGIE